MAIKSFNYSMLKLVKATQDMGTNGRGWGRGGWGGGKKSQVAFKEDLEICDHKPSCISYRGSF